MDQESNNKTVKPTESTTAANINVGQEGLDSNGNQENPTTVETMTDTKKENSSSGTSTDNATATEAKDDQTPLSSSVSSSSAGSSRQSSSENTNGDISSDQVSSPENNDKKVESNDTQPSKYQQIK